MRQTSLFILTFLSFFNVYSQTVDKRQLYKLDLENPKEKKIFVEGNLCILNFNQDNIYKDEHREFQIFHKKFIRYSVKTNEQEKNIYDSLINSGFNKPLKVNDISAKCDWKTEIIKIDSSIIYKDPYKNTVDTNKYFKAIIKLNFFYSTKKKSDTFVFTGYIQAGGHKQTLKADNTCDSKSTNGFRVLYFPDCDIYKIEFPYPDLYEYWSDFYNSELIIYF